jgi:hypothetical protein
VEGKGIYCSPHLGQYWRHLALSPPPPPHPYNLLVSFFLQPSAVPPWPYHLLLKSQDLEFKRFTQPGWTGPDWRLLELLSEVCHSLSQKIYFVKHTDIVVSAN